MKIIISVLDGEVSLLPSSSTEFLDRSWEFYKLPLDRRASLREWFELVLRYCNEDRHHAAFELLVEMKNSGDKLCSTFLQGELHLMESYVKLGGAIPKPKPIVFVDSV
jgi:hypothetical protein